MKIGSLEFEQPIVLAPMEDVTDIASRSVCRRYGADIVYTEFTSSEAIIRSAKKAIRKIKITKDERPVGIQLFGSVELSMARAAQTAEAFRPDIIDINAGCWVKDCAMRGDGAGLLRNLPLFERIIRAVVNATKLPVTVKTRLGWDDDSIVILDVAKMVEQAGAKALTVHFRTRCQGYKGHADWRWAEKIKKVISIPLIGNGDVQTCADVKTLFDSGCDGVMIGRAAIGNPWIFQQARHYMKTGQHLALPSPEERFKVCLEHLKQSVEDRGLRNGIVPFRKFYSGYLKGLPNVSQLRSDLVRMDTVEEIEERLYRFLDKAS